MFQKIQVLTDFIQINAVRKAKLTTTSLRLAREKMLNFLSLWLDSLHEHGSAGPFEQKLLLLLKL